MNIKGYIKSDLVAQVLTAGMKSGQNVVLYGKGGYGKSEMSLAFLRQNGVRSEQLIIKSLSIGTTLDDLLGGINIKILKETGEISFNVENSIFSRPYLILEEAFDAPVRVLEGLKDILTSGYIRNGHQSYKIRTKFIIVCTNRSKSELASDESSKALMERFPLSLKVEWDSHELSDYQDLIKTVFGEENSTFDALMSYMLESIKEDETKQPPAPRTVVRMYKIMKSAGIQALRFLDGLPNIDRALKNLEETQRKIQEKRRLEKLYKELTTFRNSISENTPFAKVRQFNEKARQYNDRAENFDLSKIELL